MAIDRSELVNVGRLEDALRMTVKGISNPSTIHPSRDEQGHYQGLGAWLEGRADGRIYGVKVPKNKTTECVKTGANVGLIAEAGTLANPGRDDYRHLSPFYHVDVNGGAEDNGMPFVKAIREHDDDFALDGSNGDVFVMAPVLYERITETDDYTHIEISDTKLEGFVPQPGAYTADGELKPFMLYAKYGLGNDDGKAVSHSGAKPFVSVQIRNQFSACADKGKAYSGKTAVDDRYIKVMYLLKYANKNSQSTLAPGLTSNWKQIPIVKAEKDVKHITIAADKAGSFVLGETVCVGTENTDINNAAAHDIVDYAFVTNITTHGDTAELELQIDKPISIEDTYFVFGCPAIAGSCDEMIGDGSPYSTSTWRAPYCLQGIELNVGHYEILCDIRLKYTKDSEGNPICQVYELNDVANYSESITKDFKPVGVLGEIPEGNAWTYPTGVSAAGSFLAPAGSGASSSTGLSDGVWLYGKDECNGREQYPGTLGNMSNGSPAGLFCVSADYGAGGGWWGNGSRLSVNGR